MKHATIAAALILAGCGGNYSNEDLDYQLSLPQRADIVARLPATVDQPCVAELYKMTRDVVAQFRGIDDAFLGLIDSVRAYPPTTRTPDRRTWGPFPNDKHRDWLVRVVITHVYLPEERFEYSVDFRPARGTDGDWKALITGHFAPGGGVRKGKGQLALVTADARAAAYPLDGLNDVAELHIDYQTNDWPVTIGTSLSNSAGQSVKYSYAEQMNGDGGMTVTFPSPMLAPFVTEIEIASRWKGSGVGRADEVITAGLAAGMKGVDCWGIDTCPTYSQRDFDAQRKAGAGDPSSCAFPAP